MTETRKLKQLLRSLKINSISNSVSIVLSFPPVGNLSSKKDAEKAGMTAI